MNETILPVAAGVVASALTEVVNRTGAKVPARTLQGVAFTLAAVGVVGFQMWGGHPVDWNLVVPQVIAAWGVSLAAHDVASPRR